MRRTVSFRTGGPIGQPEVGIHYVINGIKHFWTGRQWVSEEYLRLVMNPPREYEIYDRHNKRRAAVASTKRNRSQS